MTQEYLADKVGVTGQAIIAIEQGKCSPSLPRAFRTAGTFNVKAEDVFRLDGG